MIGKANLAMVFGCFLASVSPCGHVLSLEDDAGWVSLFDGESLAGWTQRNGTATYRIDGDAIVGKTNEGSPNSFLCTDKRYGDFVLDLEYSYPPGGNSGVFCRVGDLKDPVSTGIECQILDSSKHEGAMTHHDHGGIISTVGAAKNMSKAPGEWNHMTVTCKGHHLEVELNGEKIIDVELDESAVKDRPLEGYIGLQDHGEQNDIKFRRIRIKEL